MVIDFGVLFVHSYIALALGLAATMLLSAAAESRRARRRRANPHALQGDQPAT